MISAFITYSMNIDIIAENEMYFFIKLRRQWYQSLFYCKLDFEFDNILMIWEIIVVIRQKNVNCEISYKMSPQSLDLKRIVIEDLEDEEMAFSLTKDDEGIIEIIKLWNYISILRLFSLETCFEACNLKFRKIWSMNHRISFRSLINSLSMIQ